MASGLEKRFWAKFAHLVWVPLTQPDTTVLPTAGGAGFYVKYC